MTINEASIYIRENVDIVEYISNYVKLKRVGNNYFGLCPFHNEKTPSFSVNRAKKIFKCFGCGEHGDIITFVAKINNLNYKEAVKLIAEDLGLVIEEDREDKLHEIFIEAEKAFCKALKSKKGSIAMEYLYSRGLNPEIIDAFNLGFDPEQDYIVKSLDEYPIEDLKFLKLVNENNRDIFFDRIIFPIRTQSGNISGFGGRALNLSNTSKYINNKILFNHRSVLYGINHAIKEINTTKKAIIVEGFFDVLAMHQGGFKTTVGLFGTNLTDEQCNYLSKKINEAYIILDSDSAGLLSAFKSSLKLLSYNILPRIVVLPLGEDPDVVVINRKEQMVDFISNAFNMVEFSKKIAQEFYDGIKSPNFMTFLANTAYSLQTSPLLEIYINEMAEAIGINKKTFYNFIRKGSKIQNETYDNNENIKTLKIENIELMMAKLLIENNSLINILNEDDLFIPYTETLKSVMSCINNDKKISDSIYEVVNNLESDLPATSNIMRELLVKWRIKDIEINIENYKKMLQTNSDIKEILEIIQDLSREKAALQSKAGEIIIL